MAEGRMTGNGQDAHAARLSVVATATDGIRVLSLAGEIDHTNAETLRQALDVTGIPRPRIVVDLRQVTFMDSTGVNILIAAYQAVTAAEGWIRLAAPAPAISRVLQLVGVDSIITCRPTLREALTP
ncbi:STAS domain-containing protein (plasmid) [Streptomyces longwoodensis]|uniref:STAS domain-containing protein n=1 Tax=Streptomyces longwoodensis TaxID=68231 RepID=UPI002F90B1BB